MKKSRRLLAIIMTMMMFGTLMAGCGTNSAAPTEAPKAEEAPAAEAETEAPAEAPAAEAGDNVIRYQLGNVVDSMDPALSNDGTSCGVLAQCIEGMYTKDENGTPVLGQGASAEVSEDGLTWTFTIRDDAQWANGTPVTAADFEYAWKRSADPATASPYQWFIQNACIKNADPVVAGEMDPSELGVTAVDEKTLVLELSVPCAMLESLLTSTCFNPLNQEFVEACGDSFATSADTILCNGPFMISEYQPSAMTVKAVKNDSYYGAADVALGGIEWQVIEDSQTAAMSYSSGDLDVVTLAGSLIEQYSDDPEFSTRSDGYEWYIAPNMNVKGLENLNIRLALAKSFNKEAITAAILKDGSAVTDAVVPAGLAISEKGTDFRNDAAADGYDQFKYDVAAAQEYWAKGLEELGVETLEYSLVCDDTESVQEVAQFMQSEWQNNLPGLTITLKVEPKKARLEDMRNGAFELGLNRWGPDYADPMTYMDIWESASGTNYEKWSNAEYDEIIASAKTGELALDTAARWDKLVECEKMLADDCVLFPIYTQAAATLIKSNVSGIQFYTLGIPYILKNASK